MAKIDISDLTSKEPDGGGVFDDLMESAKAHVIEEFNKKRINQADYAKVYLGMMAEVLGQASQFVLQKQQADKQADLIDAQIEGEKTNTVKTHQEISNLAIQGKVLIGQAEKMEQEVLVEQQRVLVMEQEVLKSIGEVSMLAKQEDKIDAEITIAYQQLQTMASEIALTEARTDLAIAQADAETQRLALIPHEISLIQGQVANLTKEGLILDKRLLLMDNEISKMAAEIALLSARANTEAKQIDMMDSQISKIDKELALIQEKVYVEQAQYSDTTDSSLNAGAVDGVIGKQVELYRMQAEGFERDAEQKFAKIMLDSWNVRKSADPYGTTTASTGLQQPNIGVVLEQLAKGVKIPVGSSPGDFNIGVPGEGTTN